MSLTVEDLKTYITQNMRMSHVYQPVMLKVLLDGGGAASVREIAKALLSYDESQVEYYELRAKNMVGRVLSQNDVVEPVKEGRQITGYRINTPTLSDTDRIELQQLCDKRLEEYLDKHGKSIWEHRSVTSGYVPGSIRYEVLKRAKRRCELCGAYEDQIALHVDHIVPRAKGGSDEISNFQALCMTCNTNKRDTDDTDFREVLQSYENRADDCLFCSLETGRVVAENELCIAIRDAFPVTPMHTLVIPKRHVSDYFDLYQAELNAVHSMLSEQRQLIRNQDPTVNGFNVGANAGKDAGQTIFHAHIHLIPRRKGDVEEPRGGVRGVIPDKRSY